MVSDRDACRRSVGLPSAAARLYMLNGDDASSRYGRCMTVMADATHCCRYSVHEENPTQTVHECETRRTGVLDAIDHRFTNVLESIRQH